jgi:ubiquitin carboxyl-terminal hydrolase 7
MCLSLKLAKVVGDHLQVDPLLLQFFKPSVHRQFSDQAIRYACEGTLRDFVVSNRSRNESTIYYLFYQKLSIPINEFENKRWFKCIFVNSKLKEEKEFTVYVDKTGTIENLLNEAKNEVSCDID